MKRTLSLITILAMLALLFAGCAEETFDWDANIDKLLAEGLTVDKNYTSASDLEAATTLFNSQIRVRGGDFSVEIKKATILLKDGDTSFNCQFIEFASANQAQKYAEQYASARAENNAYKIATCGSIVVLTNLEIAWQVIDLEFK